jgi:predicted GNAT superfamily acetyltransferase
MRGTLEGPELAERAAVEAAVDVRLLASIEEFRDASAIFDGLWGTGPANAQMPAELMRALAHAGNYAAGAWRDGTMVGAVVGFLGQDAKGPHLHSHILGVSGGQQARGTGFALKQHQRAWALEHGLSRVTWTFDPLVRRNAYFNLHKLAADPEVYFENFYGAMTDAVNAGDESDRLFVSWQLDAPKVLEAASGRPAEHDADDLLAAGAIVALADVNGAPQANGARGSVMLCATPADVVTLRRSSADLAQLWRHALRDTLGAAMRDGFVVRGFTRSGWYVLGRDDGSART